MIVELNSSFLFFKVKWVTSSKTTVSRLMHPRLHTSTKMKPPVADEDLYDGRKRQIWRTNHLGIGVLSGCSDRCSWAGLCLPFCPQGIQYLRSKLLVLLIDCRPINPGHFGVYIRSNDSVKTLKRHIFSRTLVLPEDRTLTSEGKVLLPHNGARLYNYGIRSGQVVYMSVKLNGGAPPVRSPEVYARLCSDKGDCKSCGCTHKGMYNYGVGCCPGCRSYVSFYGDQRYDSDLTEDGASTRKRKPVKPTCTCAGCGYEAGLAESDASLKTAVNSVCNKLAIARMFFSQFGRDAKEKRQFVKERAIACADRDIAHSLLVYF
jgi:stage V sporulation protein SpoVS